MTIDLNIRTESEAILREALGHDLGAAALEALLIEGYRCGNLSTGDIADVLGLETRFQAEQWLCDRDVHANYTVAELESDRRTLERVLGTVAD